MSHFVTAKFSFSTFLYLLRCEPQCTMVTKFTRVLTPEIHRVVESMVGAQTGNPARFKGKERLTDPGIAGASIAAMTENFNKNVLQFCSVFSSAPFLKKSGWYMRGKTKSDDHNKSDFEIV
ncbi:hypothetical protein PoB_004066000 [Plakobranchus ocellatus]|uniref:Uncharacterized protein n=1 Tax=Plakobranchus ocellatus TaxID=259542 RepID=A0AAV4B0P4_9GAST|nr:hypothetical protein PoB_004066000 [Plakobranchus ocellatus]